MQTENPKKGKVKSSYVTNKEAHGENHSWDSDSDTGQEPISHSRQHLTPREKNSKKSKRQHEPNNLANEAIPEDHDTDHSLNTGCVPLNTETQVTG